MRGLWQSHNQLGLIKKKIYSMFWSCVEEKKCFNQGLGHTRYSCITVSRVKKRVTPLAGVRRRCPSHVVRHIYGVQLVSQETISEMHPLLLSSGVDGDHARVHHNHHSHNEVVLLQDNVCYQGHQVQCFLLGSLQLHHHNQEVGPCEHSTKGSRKEEEKSLHSMFNI